MDTIFLDRAYMPFGTFGVITMPSGTVFYTVERPWRGNQQSISCIPEGQYDLRKRPSSVVNRTSHGKYTEGWEIADVVGRTYIMVHIANTVDDLEGCIGVGMTPGYVNAKWAVGNSASAFKEFMAEMETLSNPSIVIRVSTIEYP